MILIAIYFGIGYGAEKAGWSYWRALFWPASVGAKIARWCDA